MPKKIAVLLLLVLSVITFTYIFSQKEAGEPQLPPEETEVPSDSEAPSKDRNTEMITEIYTQSLKGMLPDISLISGESQKEEVLKEYGKPSTSDDTQTGRYETYPGENLTVGYEGDAVYDLRSDKARYQEIKKNEILDELGQPDETTFYKESGYDHTIMIYKVSSSYELKWILDNSLNSENPPTDHISVVSTAATADEPPASQDNPPLSQIEETLSRMTLEEKIGQMIFAGISGTKPDAASLKLITDDHVGGIIFNSKNLSDPHQTVRYVNSLKDANKGNPVPLFFGIDQEGGRISKLPGDILPLPSAAATGEKNSEAYSYELGRTLAELVRAYGFNLDFAPVMDVSSNPDNPVIGDRSFGNTPDLVTRHGIKVMKGLQDGKIIPAVKHFPGHGDTSVDSHLALPTVSKTREELEKLEFIPFEHAISQGADMVKIAHLLLPELDPDFPSSLSRIVINDLLRERMGFKGVIITDDLSMNAISDHYNLGDAAVRTVQAGSDIIMVAHDHTLIMSALSGLKKAVESGSLTEERIDESVMRILQLKEKYAIADNPVENPNLEKLNSRIRSLEDVN